MTQQPPKYWQPASDQAAPAQMDVDVDGAAIEDRSQRDTSVISMDDIEAAHALEGLRSDYTHSPTPTRGTDGSSVPPAQTPETYQQEPLLSLLTSSHPLLSSAINGSMSVYASSKTYSPKFRYGAEFIERNIGPRVVNTVETVGRKTGVEGGLRWALQRGAPNANPNSRPAAAQEQQPVEAMDVEKGIQDIGLTQTRRSSTYSTTDTLPPYDNLSSPNYDDLPKRGEEAPPPQSTQVTSTWQNRLMISTSGLGVAMSEESLRSLSYCLTWLQWANKRLDKSIISLKELLQEWEQSQSDENPNQESMNNNRPRSPTLLSQHIQQVKSDVLQTLKMVVDVVSKYAGGALPENARNLVRRHLTSLPQRFRIASCSNLPTDSSIPQGEMATKAHRVLVLAEEGLDMMSQVNKVVSDTLASAESWCDRLRRPRPARAAQPSTQVEMQQPLPSPFQHGVDIKLPVPRADIAGDVEMTGTNEKA